MKKLLLVFCFALLMAGSAAAQPVTLTNIGTVDLPPDIVVTPVDKDADATRYVFRIKDGEIWRSMAIETSAPFVLSEQDKKKNLQVLWEHFLSNELPTMPNTISAEPAKKLTLDGKDCMTASFESAGPGVVLNLEAFMVFEPDDIKAVLFMCADSDRPYWQPIMLKIVSAASSKGAIS